jgi:hypothetical protein
MSLKCCYAVLPRLSKLFFPDAVVGNQIYTYLDTCIQGSLLHLCAFIQGSCVLHLCACALACSEIRNLDTWSMYVSLSLFLSISFLKDKISTHAYMIYAFHACMFCSDTYLKLLWYICVWEPFSWEASKKRYFAWKCLRWCFFYYYGIFVCGNLFLEEAAGAWTSRVLVVCRHSCLPANHTTTTWVACLLHENIHALLQTKQ